LVGCHFAWLLDPALSSRLRPVTPLVTPLSFGWFVALALPRDSAYCTDGCVSRHAIASCASTPLIRESVRCRLPPLSPHFPSRTTSPSPEQGGVSLNITVFVVIAARVHPSYSSSS
jgi:hypothetical protein